ncbi:MAG: NAD(P)H-binding protein [candidate division Zixibacteria bacterium]|nr:NAD(P)H-binding protein [candidate division Zixibacteria bacterium]
MPHTELHAVTGAFGYTGRFITHRLLDKGIDVIALTNSVNRDNPFMHRVAAVPFNFDYPAQLTESLHGVKTLYNTYWVRFNHRLFSIANAVENTLIMFEAAKSAGVERIVHVSITNPSVNSQLEYFSGKARVEHALEQSGMSYAILRPAIIFGADDILINNIAWALRRLPVMGVFGDGQYRLQPIYVGDMADLAVHEGAARENAVIDAIGPETFTYRELVEIISQAVGVRRPVVNVGPGFGYWIARLLGKFVGDVILTRDEIKGLMTELLYTSSAPAGQTRLSEWIQRNGNLLGRSYASELTRRANRHRSYGDL